LHAHPKTIPAPLHGTFEHVTNIQLAANLLEIDCFALVSKCGVPTNHERDSDASDLTARGGRETVAVKRMARSRSAHPQTARVALSHALIRQAEHEGGGAFRQIREQRHVGRPFWDPPLRSR